jgi:hypothetical protein
MREFKDIANKHGISLQEVERLFKLEFNFVHHYITKGDQDGIMLKNFGTIITNRRASHFKKLSDFNSREEFIKYIADAKNNKRLRKLSKKASESTE